MVQVIVVVREIGRLKPDFSMPFELPEVPAPGAYLSITRPSDAPLHSEDLVVRHVWWRLTHPETEAVVEENDVKVGSLTEIFVECDVAEGPYATDHWRRLAAAGRERGHEVPQFEVSRYAISQAGLSLDDH